MIAKGQPRSVSYKTQVVLALTEYEQSEKRDDLIK